MHITMSWPGVSARRLHRNHLSRPGADPPDRIAADMLAVHAQVMSAAELSLGIRGRGITRTAVRDALWIEKTLVKTRGPRGTVHLVAAADLPMWTGALSAVPTGANPWPEPVRMTEEQTEQVIAAIGDAAAEAELTVDELTDAIVARTGPWAGERVMEAFQDKWPRWRQAESVATSRGVLCFGPHRGRRVTYTSPATRLAGFAPAPGEQAVGELIRRFLWAYGPATPAEFARWLGAPPGWATAEFTRREGIERVDFEGATAYVNEGDTGHDDPVGGVRLLPYFDAYLIAVFPRRLLFPGRAAERALSGGQAGNVPALLVGGRVAGVWHQRRSGRKLSVTVEPLIRLTAAQRRLVDAEVARASAILEADATVTFGEVTAGAHA